VNDKPEGLRRTADLAMSPPRSLTHSRVMRVEFKGYAEDCVVTGTVEVVDRDRLSDFLGAVDEFEVAPVTVTALHDGRVTELPSLIVTPADLMTVVATGPRGARARRIRTRPHPMRLQAGGYEVVGFVHAPPTANPQSVALHRAIVPMTEARIRYRVGDQVIEESCEGLLVNRGWIDWMAPATDGDLRLSGTLPPSMKVDPQGYPG
jgi:hypothetical protein